MQGFKTGNLPAVLSSLTKIRHFVSEDDSPPIDDLLRTQIVPYIIQLLKPEAYEEENILVEALWILVNIASRESDHVNYLVGNEIIPKILPLLEHSSFQVQENVIWILANICGESLVYRNEMLKNGFASKFDHFLKDFEGPESIVSCSAWLISNLCRGEPFPNFEEVK